MRLRTVWDPLCNQRRPWSVDSPSSISQVLGEQAYVWFYAVQETEPSCLPGKLSTQWAIATALNTNLEWSNQYYLSTPQPQPYLTHLLWRVNSPSSSLTVTFWFALSSAHALYLAKGKLLTISRSPMSQVRNEAQVVIAVEAEMSCVNW